MADLHPVVYGVSFPEGCVGADGGVARGRATLSWQHAGIVTAESTGSFRILQDGSRTIGWGQPVPPTGVVFSEVDEQGNDLLDLLSPDGLVSYRAVKVPIAAFSLAALRAAAGQ